MIGSDFAVFILTHGRANNVKTYATLRNSGYTGKIYLILDTPGRPVQKPRFLYRSGDQVNFSDKFLEY